MTTGIYAGSFNPFTTGHASIVARALTLFDRVIIAIGVNIAKPGEDAERRREHIAALYAGEKRVEVVVWKGLAVELARRYDARWLIRGVRSAADFEAERNMADANRAIGGIDTLLLPALPELGFVSSSMVRELERFGADTSPFLPQNQENKEL